MNLERILSTYAAPVLAATLLYGNTYAQEKSVAVKDYYATVVAVDESTDRAFFQEMENSELSGAYGLALLVRLKIGKEPKMNEKQRDYIQKYVKDKNIPCTADLNKEQGLDAIEFIKAPTGTSVTYMIRMKAASGGYACFKPGQFVTMVRGIASLELKEK